MAKASRACSVLAGPAFDPQLHLPKVKAITCRTEDPVSFPATPSFANSSQKLRYPGEATYGIVVQASTMPSPSRHRTRCRPPLTCAVRARFDSHRLIHRPRLTLYIHSQAHPCMHSTCRRFLFLFLFLFLRSRDQNHDLQGPRQANLPEPPLVPKQQFQRDENRPSSSCWQPEKFPPVPSRRIQRLSDSEPCH